MTAAIDSQVSRRSVLQGAVSLVVVATAESVISVGLAQQDSAAEPPYSPPSPTSLNAWLVIDSTSRVTAFFGKVDLAQGVDTAIAQIVAEELDVSVDAVSVVMGDTARTFNQGGLSASTACSTGAKPLRNAAAEARRILLNLAAEHFSAPVEQLVVHDGRVTAGAASAAAISYGELLSGQQLGANLTWNGKVGNLADVVGEAGLKPVEKYRIVGQPVPRKDLPAKILATAEFCHHVTLPGMLHARIVRPPTANGQPVTVDENSIREIAGARVVRIRDFVAVAAPTEWAAIRASRTLRVHWTTPPPPFPSMEELHSHIRTSRVTASNGGSAFSGQISYDTEPTSRALADSARVIESEYELPFHSHARMAPSVAVASVDPSGVVVYSDTQKPHLTRLGLSKLLEVPEERIRVIWKPGPGSYGRSDGDEAAFEAALISRELAAPVRVQWMRDEGLAWDPKAPAAVVSLKAGFGADGSVSAFFFRAKGFSGWEVAQNAANPGDTLAGMQLGFERTDGKNFAVFEQSYAFPNAVRFWETIPALQHRASPLRCAHMRGPQEMQVQFGLECFIDEMAAASDVAPFAFRMRHLTDEREKQLLDAAVNSTDWSREARPGSRGRGSVLVGRGMAAGPMWGTYVAIVCEVEVERSSGKVRTRRVAVAHDCGLVINPLGLRRAIEGGIVQGISRTLCEEVQFDPSRVTSVDWFSYPILDVMDAPDEIAVTLIENTSLPPSGGGEAAGVFIPAAIGNALFDATGVRYRKLPLTAERVRAGLV